MQLLFPVGPPLVSTQQKTRLASEGEAAVELNNLLSILLPTSHSNSAGYPMTNSLPSGVGGLRHRLELYGLETGQESVPPDFLV